MISLEHQFTVNAPLQDTWAALTDLPRVAGCMPGAWLTEDGSGDYEGGVATRVGPINAKYQGSAAIQEKDEVSHRLVIEARGREEKGSGSASALITVQLDGTDGQAHASVVTELSVSGKAAQFGRSLLAEVSNSLAEQFVTNLEEMLAGTPAQDAGQQTSGTSAGAAVASRGPASAAPSCPTPMNLSATLAGPLLRQYGAPIAAAAITGAVGLLVGRRGGNRGPAGLTPAVWVVPCCQLARHHLSTTHNS